MCLNLREQIDYLWTMSQLPGKFGLWRTLQLLVQFLLGFGSVINWLPPNILLALGFDRSCLHDLFRSSGPSSCHIVSTPKRFHNLRNWSTPSSKNTYFYPQLKRTIVTSLVFFLRTFQFFRCRTIWLLSGRPFLSRHMSRFSSISLSKEPGCLQFRRFSAKESEAVILLPCVVGSGSIVGSGGKPACLRTQVRLMCNVLTHY